MAASSWVRVTPLMGMLVLSLGCAKPVALVKVDGDGLTAPIGQSVPVAPVVQVVDRDQRGVSGVKVRWTAGQGGSVGKAETQTDANGRATCESWLLGPTRGINLLEVSVAGLDPVSFTAVGINATTTVQVNIVVPTSGLVPSRTKVGVNATSPYSLSSVVASVEGASVPLTVAEASTCDRYDYACPRYGFGGTIDLSQQAPDVPVALFVTATDALGDVGEAAVVVTRNDPPTVTLTAPIDGALANPTVDVAVSCSDDAARGCVSLTASLYAGTVRVELASGTTELRTQLDLSQWEGYAPRIDFEGTDELGQVTRVSRSVQINSSAGLTLRTMVPGDSLDVLGSRVLYRAGTQVRILDTSNRADALVFDEPKFCQTAGTQSGECLSFLTPQGAVYVLGEGTSQPGVYDWREGTALRVGELGPLPQFAQLQVEGGFAAFSARDAGSAIDKLVVRDLDASANFEISPSSSLGDVSASGDVVFVDANGLVQRWRAGVVTTLSSGSPGMRYELPVTDGDLVAFRACDATTCSLAINDGSSERLIDHAVNDPLIANGWLAYARSDQNDIAQVWRHGPEGETQTTFFSNDSLPELVGPDGNILFIRRSTLNLGADWERFRVVGVAPQSLGPRRGRAVLRDGKVFILSGPNVIEVAP